MYMNIHTNRVTRSHRPPMVVKNLAKVALFKDNIYRHRYICVIVDDHSEILLNFFDFITTNLAKIKNFEQAHRSSKAGYRILFNGF